MVIEMGGSPVLLISKLAQMKISSAPPSPTMPTRRRLFSLAQCQLVEGQIIQLEIASNPFSFIPRHSSDLSEPTSDHLKTRLEQLVLMFVSGSESAGWYAEGVSQCVLGWVWLRVWTYFVAVISGHGHVFISRCGFRVGSLSGRRVGI